MPMTVTDEAEYVANPIGNIQPDLTMSVSPTFTYKGVTLSAMFDMKFGGDIFSYSEMMSTVEVWLSVRKIVEKLIII